MNKLLKIIIISFLIVLLSSCRTYFDYNCIENYEKNPTSYIFHQDMTTIRQILIEKEGEIKNVFCPYYKESLKSNKVFVNDLGSKLYCESKFYFKAPKENDSIGLWSDSNRRDIYFKSNGLDIFLVNGGYKSSEVCF